MNQAAGRMTVRLATTQPAELTLKTGFTAVFRLCRSCVVLPKAGVPPIPSRWQVGVPEAINATFDDLVRQGRPSRYWLAQEDRRRLRVLHPRQEVGAPTPMATSAPPP